MSFREKSAWVTLITILLIMLLYLLHVPRIIEPNPGRWMFHALIGCVGVFIIIEVVAHAILFLRSPRDALAPRDEREELIELKALRVAAYVYLVFSFGAVATTHLGANGFAVGYGVLLAFVIAQIVNCSMRIYYYRRGV